MSTPRRDFLGWLGGSALFATAGIPLRSENPLPPRLQQKSGDFDFSWTDRVKGTHRAVFDSPGVSEGAAVFRAVVWGKQYKAAYGTDPADMTAVLVLRHEGIALAMDDAYWAEFQIGKENKLKDEKGKKWATTNPVAVAAPGTPAQYADYNLASFQKNGGIVLACNMAFADVVSRYKDKTKATPADARKMAIAHLVPGVILQPSGVFAALRAQEVGCHYLHAS
jgi:hypothetical protein